MYSGIESVALDQGSYPECSVRFRFMSRSGFARSKSDHFTDTVQLFSQAVYWLPTGATLSTSQRSGTGVEGCMPTGRTMINAALFRFQFRDDSRVM